MIALVVLRVFLLHQSVVVVLEVQGILFVHNRLVQNVFKVLVAATSLVVFLLLRLLIVLYRLLLTYCLFFILWFGNVYCSLLWRLDFWQVRHSFQSFRTGQLVLARRLFEDHVRIWIVQHEGCGVRKLQLVLILVLFD